MFHATYADNKKAARRLLESNIKKVLSRFTHLYDRARFIQDVLAVRLHKDIPVLAKRHSRRVTGFNFVFVVDTRNLIGLPIALGKASVCKNLEAVNVDQSHWSDLGFPIA